ncbi:MAG: 2,3-bisphosphoglycerate-independent phosphoglycerate mutase [Clostridiales bacterium]|nr:2,3-bisphosphoglycerate-independent phosphoglycerate mutase [Clostridiales bacterium]
MKNLTALIILDGWGISDKMNGNAVKIANTPNFDRLTASYPNIEIEASGMDVGLPDGQMGNSEVGHLNIGAGRIVYQELTRITKAIKDGVFFENEAFLGAIENAKKNNSSLHLLGLLSDGGVHSHINHIKGLIDLAKKNNIDKLYLHVFMDGRDTPPNSGIEYINEIEKYMVGVGVGKIATVSGRYYAMDRDNRWERVEKAYNALANGVGIQKESAVELIKENYSNDVTDEFIIPSVIIDEGKPIASIKENDSVIFFNFRPDRARELTDAFTEEGFSGFSRELFKLYYVTITKYDERFKNVHIAFKPQVIKNTLGEYVSKKGKKQLRIAETEKYAHVTFFFNGGVEKENEGEDRILVSSPKVATYDLKPEMSSYEVTDKLLEAIDRDYYDLIILNYANADMVGHTGVLEAAVKAVEAVDENLGRVINKILSKGGSALITADHGNAEKMIDEITHKAFTAHSTNPVPLIVVGEGSVLLEKTGRLSDIAPTLLYMMGIEVPVEMTGKNLIKNKEE